MDVVRGDVVLGLTDKATPELRRVEHEYRAALARIDAMEAEAKIGADTSELDAALKQARDRVRILDGQLHAEAEIGADTSELQKELAIARAEVKQLDGLKAEIEIETRGERQALANIAKVRAAEAQRAAAQQRYMANAEKAAYRENEVRRRGALNAARDEAQMIRLAQKWSKLTDEVEKADRAIKRMPFRTEKRVQLEVDRARAMADMELVKKEMEFRGGHPPVKIRVDTDSQRAEAGMGRIKRALFGLRDSAARGGGRIFDALGNVGALRVLGNRLSTLVKVASVLSPVLVSVAGAATGLVGVLGTGLAGAAAIGAGALGGMILNMGGVVAAIHPMISDFKIAHQATQAYSKAVLKYGASSKQAKTAQDQMNHALAGVSPQAADAARNMTKLSTEWQKLTGKTARTDVGMVMNQVMRTMHTAMPAMAKNTNQTMNIITGGISHMMASIRQNTRSDGKGGIIGSLGRSFNNFLGPAMRGAEHLGAAIARIAESAARLFAGPAGHGFERWAAHFDKSTQNSDKLDATIKRLGNHATDLLHFFGALGRLLMTVFNGGADSGDRMVKSMTHALNRWNKFLQSPRGQTSMADFFKRAEGGARALWGALGPLIAAFVQWSSLLAPFTSGLLKGVGFVSKLVAGFTRLVGMKGSLGALGATIGVMFAVSKIAGFVGMLGRVVGLLRTAGGLARAGRIADAFKSLGNIGGALSGKGAGIAGQIEGAGTAAGREMATQIEAAGSTVAGEIRTAMQTGGATAATEVEGGHAAGGRVAAEEIAAGEAAGGKVAAEEIAAGEVAGGAGGGAGFLGKLGGGGLLSKLFKGAGAIGMASIIGRQLLGAEGDPLAFLFNPSSAGGPGDSVSTSPSLKKAESALDKAFGGAKARRLAGDFEMGMDGMFKHQETRMKDVFGKKVPISVTVDDAKAQARMHDTFTKLERTTKGKRFVATLAVQLKGNQLAQEQVAKLASTKLGSKLLMILSKGGPEAAKWLAHIADTNIGHKLVNIITHGGPAAQKLVAALSDKKIRNKVFDIIQHGGPGVQRQLEKLLGIKIKNKDFSIHAHDFTRPVLDGIKAAINAIHGKTVTIATRWVNFGKAAGNAAGALLGRASGGMGGEWGGGNQELWKKQQRALDIASARGPSQQRYGKFNRPTLLVGEEDRSEIVISTNPKYRKTNIRYLMDAARELGVNFVEAAAGGKGRRQIHIAPGVKHLPYVRGAPTTSNNRGTPYSQMFSDPFYHEHGAHPFEGIKNTGSLYGDIPPIIGNALDAALGKPGELRAQLAGRFDITTVDAIKKRADDTFNRQRDAFNNASDKLRAARHEESQAVKEYNKAKTKKARDKASRHIGRTQEDMRYWYWYAHKARVGGSVMGQNRKKRLTFLPMTEVENMKEDADTTATQLHTWYDNREHLSKEAQNYETQAENAASRYRDAGNSVDLEAYRTYIAKAKRDWGKVRSLDDEAIGIAQDLQSTMKNPKALQALLDDLIADEGTADAGSLRTGEGATEPGFTGVPEGQMDLNTYLTQQGVFDASPYTTLAQERTALDTSFAQAGIGDDPAHPDTYADDLRAADKLQTFWQGVYDRMNSDPSLKDSAVLGEAATALTGAQSTYRDIYAAANPAADISTSMGLQLSAADTARQDVLAQYGSNVQGLQGLNPLTDPAGRGMGFAEMNAAMLTPDYGVIGGGSGMSTRGSGANAVSGGGSVHVVNHFGAPPPDPHTWSQGVKFEIGALL